MRKVAGVSYNFVNLLLENKEREGSKAIFSTRKQIGLEVFTYDSLVLQRNIYVMTSNID